MTATPNASLIKCRLTNGTIVSKNGVDGNVFYAPVAAYKGNNTAMFIANEWKVNARRSRSMPACAAKSRA